jgi:ComF family protein
MDLLFPKFCVSCAAEEKWLCANCLPKNIVPQQELCADRACMDSLDGLIALDSYGTSSMSDLIRLLKYRYITDVVSDLREIIAAVDFTTDWQNFAIIPVPLHPRRERERGFNQAEYIADLFAERLGLEVYKILRRSEYTQQQAILSGEERRKNVTKAFIFDSQSGVVPSKVLLVDDVCTTGSTLRECAKALKAAGVQTVWGLVLAKG